MNIPKNEDYHAVSERKQRGPPRKLSIRQSPVRSGSFSSSSSSVPRLDDRMDLVWTNLKQRMRRLDRPLQSYDKTKSGHDGPSFTISQELPETGRARRGDCATHKLQTPPRTSWHRRHSSYSPPYNMDDDGTVNTVGTSSSRGTIIESIIRQNISSTTTNPVSPCASRVYKEAEVFDSENESDLEDDSYEICDKSCSERSPDAKKKKLTLLHTEESYLADDDEDEEENTGEDWRSMAFDFFTSLSSLKLSKRNLVSFEGDEGSHSDGDHVWAFPNEKLSSRWSSVLQNSSEPLPKRGENGLRRGRHQDSSYRRAEAHAVEETDENNFLSDHNEVLDKPSHGSKNPPSENGLLENFPALLEEFPSEDSSDEDDGWVRR